LGVAPGGTSGERYLHVDPPDLAIKIDVSNSSLDKMAVYAELKVPEVWRWQDGN